MDVREYQSSDLEACRLLWVQLVEHHREIYADSTIGGDDPGSEFDDYLAMPDRVMTWVATDGDSIMGLTGLLWADGESTIEPVVVDRRRRRTGVGRRLMSLEHDDSDWQAGPQIHGRVFDC